MIQNLKALRTMRGVSQQQLADAVFVTQPSIHKYETQNIEPEIAILIRIADYFHTPVDYLIGRTDEEGESKAGLDARESALVAGYRQLREDERRCIDLTIEAFNRKG